MRKEKNKPYYFGFSSFHSLVLVRSLGGTAASGEPEEDQRGRRKREKESIKSRTSNGNGAP
ncbi:hypothetical protein WH47_03574 [Habropoda laboriosa]|uniref:Uncharacterized protein n=1 Tax=Habropoda laboriosa TaxID=597456 RepID=A0A0L7RID3_9HYME|nr:hypothetical protein WH47_03574 [Habropoda laboriosa]